MAQSITEWLQAFVVAELEAVLAEHKRSKKIGMLIHELDDRFSDDKSNFRSTVDSLQLTGDCRLQILSVLSSGKPPALQLTDGFCTIRATLSESARSTIESEIEGADPTGDVFSLKGVTVVSTPWGMPEGHVQLTINDLQYHYHLRKKPKHSQPIEETPKVGRLLLEMMSIRNAQIDDTGGSQSEHQSQPKESVIPSRGTLRAEPHTSIAQSAASKKRPMPSLANEGFEVEGGVNLAKPSAASQADQRKPVIQQKQVIASTTSPALLSLLNRSHATNTETLRSEQAAPASFGPIRELPSNVSAKQMLSSTAKRTTQHATPRSTRRIAYGRQQISGDQQRLLDRSDSWFPALPGQIFPHPNVPVDLLTVWNAEAVLPALSVLDEASWAEVKSVTSRSRPVSIRSSEESSDVPSEVSSEVSSEDEELTSSQWPRSSPTGSREMLPPDSTIGSGKAGQQTLPHRSPTKPQTVPPQGKVDEFPQGPISAHGQQLPLPPKPPTRSDGGDGGAIVIKGTQLSANGDEMELDVPRPLQDPQDTLHRRRRSEHYRSAQREKWLEANYSYKTISSLYGTEVHAHYRKTYPDDPVTRSEMLTVMTKVFPSYEEPPNQSIRWKEETGSVGTQPRSEAIPERPVAARRQEWFKANCVYRYDEDPQNASLAQVFQAYRDTHPHEDHHAASTTQLQSDVETAFPAMNDRPQHGIKLRRSLPPSKKASASQTSPRSIPEARHDAQLPSREPRGAQHREWLEANCLYRHEKSAHIQDMANVFGNFNAIFPGEVQAEVFGNLVKDVFPQYRGTLENGIKLNVDAMVPASTTRPQSGTSKDVRKTQHSGDENEADDDHSDEEQMVSASTSQPGPPLTAKSQLPPASREETPSPSSVAPRARPPTVEPGSSSTPRARFPTLKSKNATTEPSAGLQPADSASARSRDKQQLPTDHTAPAQSLGQSMRKVKPNAEPVRLPIINGTHTTKETVHPPNAGGARKTPRHEESDPQPGTQDTGFTQKASTTAFEDFFHAWKSLKPGGAFVKPPPGGRSRSTIARRVDILGWDV
ncbi:hypothetical protein LTR03_004228 [Friedmanniomyces endolithicus]|nr:hypothetical protein LTR03_004228 [Friedmanniomyces endolithicus]